MQSEPASRRQAAFFDRDNTLTVDAGGYTFRLEDLAWMPGAIEAVKRVNDSGGLAVVVTNQSGVARGYYEESAVLEFHAAMQADLARAGAHIDALYYCPHHADAAVERYRHPDHPDRKPNPGMLLRACAELDLDPARCVMFGDQARDVTAAERAGVHGVLYEGGDLDRLVARALRELGWPL